MDKSKYALSNALMALMQEKPYQKISIYEITRRAYVSRTTFYNHFNDKDDIIRYLLEDIFRPLTMMAATDPRRPFREYLLVYLEIVKRSGAFFLLLRQNGIINMAPDFMALKIKKTALEAGGFYERFGENADLDSFCAYESRLTFFSVFSFLDRKSILSDEELADIICDTRAIGYQETGTVRPYRPLLGDPFLRFSQGDARALHTKQALTEALNSILARCPIENISISELTETAGVSRCSFYRHYASLEQLVEESLETIYVNVIRQLPSAGHLIGYDNMMKRCLHGYEQNRAIFAALVGTEYEITALQAYRNVFDVLLWQLPYIQGYVPTDNYAREYYHWFIALEHIIPVMLYFSQPVQASVEEFSEFMQVCRYFPFQTAD